MPKHGLPMAVNGDPQRTRRYLHLHHEISLPWGCFPLPKGLHRDVIYNRSRGGFSRIGPVMSWRKKYPCRCRRIRGTPMSPSMTIPRQTLAMKPENFAVRLTRVPTRISTKTGLQSRDRSLMERYQQSIWKFRIFYVCFTFCRKAEHSEGPLNDGPACSLCVKMKCWRIRVEHNVRNDRGIQDCSGLLHSKLGNSCRVDWLLDKCIWGLAWRFLVWWLLLMLRRT